MADLINTADPCGGVAILRAIYHKVIAGKSAQQVEFDAGNGSRSRVTFTAANLSELKAEIARLEAACAAKTGGRPRRFALRAGGTF